MVGIKNSEFLETDIKIELSNAFRFYGKFCSSKNIVKAHHSHKEISRVTLIKVKGCAQVVFTPNPTAHTKRDTKNNQ